MVCSVSAQNLNNFNCTGNVQFAYFSLTISMLYAMKAYDESGIDRTPNFTLNVDGTSFTGLSIINGEFTVILASNTYDDFLLFTKNKFIINTVISRYLAPPDNFNHCNNCNTLKFNGYYTKKALDLAKNEAKLTNLVMLDTNYNYDTSYAEWITENSAITVTRSLIMNLGDTPEYIKDDLQLIFPNAVIV